MNMYTIKSWPNLNVHVTQLVGAVLKAQGRDGVGDQAQGGKVGSVGHPQGRHVGVDAIGNDAIEQGMIFQLFRRQQPHQPRISVMKGDHGVEQVGNHPGSMSDGSLALTQGGHGVSEGHGDPSLDQFGDHPALGIVFGSHGDESDVSEVLAKHVFNILHACGQVSDKVRIVSPLLLLGNEGSLSVGPQDLGAVGATLLGPKPRQDL